VSEFVNLTVQRYGLGVVQEWLFEVWNEPNCGFLYPYGADCCLDAACGSQSVYFQMYNVTARAVKAVDAMLKVGGPATFTLLFIGWLSDFKSFVLTNNIPIDFMSTHLYPTDPNVPKTREGFASVLSDAASIAQSMGLSLVVTEFNAGLSIDASDGPYAAAFVLHQLVAFQGVENVRVLSFWTFSDIFEEQGFQSVPYTQQFGLMNVYGVPKPSYRAFEMIKGVESMGDYSVQSVSAVGSVDVVAVSAQSKNGNGVVYDVTVLCTNFDVRGNEVLAQMVNLVFVNSSSFTYPLSATIEIIDKETTHGAAFWMFVGRPTYPTPNEIEKEMEVSQLRKVPIYFLSTQNGPALSFVLSPYASARIQFRVMG